MPTALPNVGDFNWGTTLNAHITEHESASAGVHGATGTIVGTTDAQTLTNKTLTAPTINDPVFGGVGTKGYLRKAASETVTSSTALQNDDDLLFTVVNAGVYDVRVALRVGPSGAGANGQFKVAFSGPGSSAWTIEGIGPSTALTTGTAATLESVSQRTASGATSTATAYGVSQSASTYVSVFLNLLLIAGGAGTVNLQWAQNASNAIGTIVDAGSYLRYERIA